MGRASATLDDRTTRANAQPEVAVLCCHLYVTCATQLCSCRKVLASRVCVTLDDRDAEELAQMDEEIELEGTKMAVGQAVRLATVDNFQVG